MLGDHSGETFQPLWAIVGAGKCYFYVTDGWSVYPGLIADGDQIVSKTYMTRVEGENTRLRHYLARLHRKTLCYSNSEEIMILRKLETENFTHLKISSPIKPTI